MKKIVFYIGSLSRGGAQRVIVTLANSLSKLGYSCIVVTTYKGENEYPLDQGIKRIVLVTEKNCFIKKNLKELYLIRKLVKKEKPDTVISFMGEPNIRMLFATVGLKCRKIISVRNDPCREYNGYFFSFFVKKFFSFSDHIVFQTDDAQKWFGERFKIKSSVILNPVDEIFFKTEYLGPRKNIVTVGRLVPQKNHKLLINAFSNVASKIDQNLIIYGDGPLKNELVNLVEEKGLQGRVFFPGTISNVPNALKSARLFVLTSDYEGMPNALMEALALGVPCISTDCPCGGPKYLLKEENLFPVNDEFVLSEMLLHFDQFENSSSLVHSFDLKTVIKTWENIL